MAERKRKSNISNTHVMTSGTTIRFEQPSSKRGAKNSTTKVIIQEVNPVGGFVNFLREHAVVGLAVGFVIGLQAQTLVRQLVDSFITPAFTLFFGQALKDRS